MRKKFLTLVLICAIMGFTLYLKPGMTFKNGSDSMRVKYVAGEGVILLGQAGRLVKVTSEDGKRYYIPVDNILFIAED